MRMQNGEISLCDAPSVTRGDSSLTREPGDFLLELLRIYGNKPLAPSVREFPSQRVREYRSAADFNT